MPLWVGAGFVDVDPAGGGGNNVSATELAGGDPFPAGGAGAGGAGAGGAGGGASGESSKPNSRAARLIMPPNDLTVSMPVAC
ncbi:hypothetical protein [Mycolicibacterium porcinum]|uniref:Uncharacterized protein n=1 Tax=Mycolicibacterium porcinum TaxID=39693 RepID=A0ABV3VN22_9MYCO